MRAMVLLFAIIGLAAVVPYWAGVGHPFVYDDHGQIEGNQYLNNARHLWDVMALKTLRDGSIINGRRPVVLLTYFADRALWGQNAAGWHATNILLHLACTWLLAGFVLRLWPAFGDARGARMTAFVAGLLFALHPVLTEAVQVPAFRPDILCSLFTLLFLHAVLRIPPRSSVFALLLALLFFALALGAKESGAVAPVLALWIWWCIPAVRPRWKMMLALLIPASGILAGYMLLCRGGASLQALGGPWNGIALRPPENVWTLPWLWTHALKLLLLPWPLVVDRIIVPVSGFADYRFWLGGSVLMISIVIAWWARRRFPPVALAMGWMLIAFAPVANIIPLFNPMADRYLYMIGMGFVLMPSAYIIMGLKKGTPIFRNMAMAVLAVLCACYIGLGQARLWVWRSDFSLWQATLAAEPRSARAHTWLGIEYKRQGQRNEAMRHFDMARRLNPYEVSAAINRAILYGQAGELRKAEEILREAAVLRPDKAAIHWNLAVALEQQGRMHEAVGALERTLACDPRHVRAMKALIIHYFAQGRIADAKALASRLLKIAPRDHDAQQASDYFNHVK